MAENSTNASHGRTLEPRDDESVSSDHSFMTQRRHILLQPDPPENENQSLPSNIDVSVSHHSVPRNQYRNRRDTQWHPPYYERQHHSNDDSTTSQRIHHTTSSSKDTTIELLTSIVNSNSKLHDSIVKQQELLMELIKSTSETNAKQTSLMETIIAGMSSIPRVPKQHFESSSTDGISFNSCHDSNTEKELSSHNVTSHVPDDASINSTHSLYGYQDTKLNLDTFDETWLEKSAATAKIWLSTAISELASKPYYHPLLTVDKKNINFAAAPEGSNATLHSTLQTKLSERFRTMMLNSGLTTGTEILKFIQDSLIILRGNKTTATNSMAEFYKIKWDPAQEDIYTFNSKFQNLLNLVLETNPSFSFDQVKYTWIQALPTDFSDLHTKFNKNNLDEKWKNVDKSGHLFIRTLEEMRHCNITFKEPNKNNDNNRSRAFTAKFLKSIPASDRGQFPADYPDSNKLLAKVTELIEAGSTRKDVETKFKEPYGYKSCWLCRILPFKKGAHTCENCPILKNLFKSYPSKTCSTLDVPPLICPLIGRSKSTSHLTSNVSTPAKIIHTNMCYDTGTTPKSLCSKREFFRDLILFDKPTYVSLADPNTSTRALGQGTLDIIINNQFRIWMHAYLTSSCDSLMSAVDHLSYKGNEIHGLNGKIDIIFPSCQFTVRASNNFEFNIHPGKTSTASVLWKPESNQLIDVIEDDNSLIQIKRVSSDALLPQRATTDSTGYDISSSQATVVPPNRTITVPLGFSMSFSNTLKCDLRPRSGLSLKGINVALGTIDPDYRGEIKAIVTNTTSTPFQISIGSRIGQLVFSPVSHPTPIEVATLPNTKRGTNGFGSSGSLPLSKSRRVHTRSSFQPRLETIHEQDHSNASYQQSHTTRNKAVSKTPKPTRESTNVNKISIEDLNKIIKNINVEVEDVPVPKAPKEILPDAIALFPLDMYKAGQLSITGNLELDKSASPHLPDIVDNTCDDHTPNNKLRTEEDSVPENNSSSPDHDSHTPRDEPHQMHQATEIFDESDFYKYTQDDDDHSVSSTEQIDTCSDDITLDCSNLHFLQSVLDNNTRPTPRIPPEDRVSSTEPVKKVVTTEYFQKCLGFRNVAPILKSISKHSKDTMVIRDTGKHPVLSRGETATLPKLKRNSNAIPRSSEYGKIWHYDIVYGNGRAIGGIVYALFFVDRKSRQKKIFGLKDLKKATLQRAMKTFIRKVGFYPDEIIADRDFKLIGEHIDDILEPFTQVSGAPSGRQSQVGLSESNWRYICNIARNYLVEHLLPPEFWFFAIKYAV